MEAKLSGDCSILCLGTMAASEEGEANSESGLESDKLVVQKTFLWLENDGS